MKIEKAIEVLTFEVKATLPPRKGDYCDALKLGIEALKYVYAQNDPDHQMMRKQLPGETL